MNARASTNLAGLHDTVGPELDRLETFLEREFRGEEPFIVELLEHVRRFRGKRLRPAVLLMIGRLARGSVSDDQIKIAAAIELVHTATLVHDDILDDAAVRRKVETLHRRWGERVAILMGDFIYSRAFHLSTQVPGAAGLLSETTNLICEGELLQIRSRFQPDMGEEAYLEIIRKKTAVLYATACELGALLSDLDPADTRKLADFGLHVGTAFQIVDDCIDYSKREDIVGKSLGSDLHQGKTTLPLILLLESAPAAEAAELLETLRQPMTPDVEARIADRVRESGALRAASDRAEEHVRSAKAVLTGLPSALREHLESVADYVLRRRR